MIGVKRVYDAPQARDGARFLVERLWPRGMKKDALRIEGWLKDIAPSAELRKWFGHDPAKWAEFRRRYRVELRANREALRPLLDAARHGTVTLLYSARDIEHNSAIVLKAVLEEQLKRTKRKGCPGSFRRRASDRRAYGRSTGAKLAAPLSRFADRL